MSTQTIQTIQASAAAWRQRIIETQTEWRECRDLASRHFVWEAQHALTTAAPWSVWAGVTSVEATSFPEVGFPHPEWKETATHDTPFTGGLGEWVDVVVPTFFGGIPLKVGDRIRLFRTPSPEFAASGTPPTYQIARRRA